MMGLMDKINRVHIAVFFDEETKISSLDLASAIRKAFITVFPDEPQMIPLPVEAPKEVPRCIFQSFHRKHTACSHPQRENRTQSQSSPS